MVICSHCGRVITHPIIVIVVIIVRIGVGSVIY
jgi:hypothetical protein